MTTYKWRNPRNTREANARYVLLYVKGRPQLAIVQRVDRKVKHDISAMDLAIFNFSLVPA